MRDRLPPEAEVGERAVALPVDHQPRSGVVDSQGREPRPRPHLISSFHGPIRPVVLSYGLTVMSS